MHEKTKKQVIDLLKEYPELIKKISLLRYELEHPSKISPNEMLEAMSFAKSTGDSRGAGAVSNKTLYIALNYSDAAEKANTENIDDLAMRLISLERTVDKLNYYLKLLQQSERDAVRLCYFERKSLQEAADELKVSVWSIRKSRDSAIVRLTEMYSFVAGSK